MTKEQSQMMKGVAILLMLFLHLFNQLPNVEACHNFIYIKGLPLVYILSRAANPVAFFLIIGGFGLYTVYAKGDKHRWSRLLKLMIHYWIILAIFLIIGHFMYPSRYPGSWLNLLSNVSGYHTTYNGEMWFLLPYVILSGLSPWLFRIAAHVKAKYIVGVTLCIHICTSFCISRYGEAFLFYNYWAYTPLLVLHLLFGFSLGAMAARTNFFERLTSLTLKSMKIIVLASGGGVIVLITVSCVFKYNFFYAFGIITCLLFIPMPLIVKRILCKLGNQSMNMWMIHSWFCYYLFPKFIYSFSYPVLILAVLIAVSYMSSIIINRIAVPVERLFLSRKEIKTKQIL